MLLFCCFSIWVTPWLATGYPQWHRHPVWPSARVELRVGFRVERSDAHPSLGEDALGGASKTKLD